MRISQYFKSLSTRLLLLTLLWVSFIVTSIAWTMLLNWELEATAAAKYAVAELRIHVHRAAYFTQPVFEEMRFQDQMSKVELQFSEIRKGDIGQPLELPRGGEFLQTYTGLEKQWHEEIAPMLMNAQRTRQPVNNLRINRFLEELAGLANQIDDWRSDYLWALRYLQVTLIVLAIGSLFTIMFLLVRWVIRPIGQLGEGINKLSGGDLRARVPVIREDEIGRIAAGFNRMADRLEDLYENLEQKVAEKTASVEEKNRHLAQLYEITSFFSQQRSLEELTDGFAERIVRYTEADACIVTLVDQKSGYVNIAAACGLTAEALREMTDISYEDSICRTVIKKAYPVRITLGEDERKLARALNLAGFTTAYCFPVRSTSGGIGCFMLLYRDIASLSSQMIQLLESFSTHLGVAIDNERLIDRDRQYAVIQERQLLAQGLHDSIAQALSYLNLQVQFLSDAIKDKDDALRDESLAAIQTGVQECYEDVRELLLNFRERLHTEGFLQGVRTVMDRFEGQAHVSTRLTASGDGPKLTPREKLQVIFIIQEALSNVRKHAEATSVSVTINNGADLVVSIVDDGVGIEESVVEARKGQHVGLSIMAERASRIGATVKVERASPIGGTRVTLTLPASSRQIS
ncbi:HAMP domain-containing protein [Sutterella sp.]|uniref:HAMP domain-containing protein n=1 Tax=Sutterella sp. TaxID=1981025 RepID=UPI0026DFEA3A|nr:HAMP domain-containing protein [Sutterella sp.]MDO5531641.1 HAMP domain-containing protein [Sutterella sp.]